MLKSESFISMADLSPFLGYGLRCRFPRGSEGYMIREMNVLGIDDHGTFCCFKDEESFDFLFNRVDVGVVCPLLYPLSYLNVEIPTCDGLLIGNDRLRDLGLPSYSSVLGWMGSDDVKAHGVAGSLERMRAWHLDVSGMIGSRGLLELGLAANKAEF